MKPPSINLDTLKARRIKINHGKVTDISKGNTADIFKNLASSDEEQPQDVDFRREMRFHPECREGGAATIARLKADSHADEEDPIALEKESL